MLEGEIISVPFSNVCISGGIVNAYNALRAAEKIPLKVGFNTVFIQTVCEVEPFGEHY